MQREVCTQLVPCGTPTGQWTHWSAWSPANCAQSCAASRTRSRTCLTTGCEGGAATEVSNCGQSVECQKPDAWSQWEQWSVCTRSCSGGVRIRRRQCPPGSVCPGQRAESEVCNDVQCNGLGEARRAKEPADEGILNHMVPFMIKTPAGSRGRSGRAAQRRAALANEFAGGNAANRRVLQQKMTFTKFSPVPRQRRRHSPVQSAAVLGGLESVLEPAVRLGSAFRFIDRISGRLVAVGRVDSVQCHLRPGSAEA